MSGIAFALQLAGLRTNAPVSSGAAMFVLGARLVGAPNDSVLRVAAQVVSGIGFLGGGLNFKRHMNAFGLWRGN